MVQKSSFLMAVRRMSEKGYPVRSYTNRPSKGPIDILFRLNLTRLFMRFLMFRTDVDVL
jgi:hypothetical protein